MTVFEVLITVFATVKGNRAFKLESITLVLMFSIFKLFASLIFHQTSVIYFAH